MLRLRRFCWMVFPSWNTEDMILPESQYETERRVQGEGTFKDSGGEDK